MNENLKGKARISGLFIALKERPRASVLIPGCPSELGCALLTC